MLTEKTKKEARRKFLYETAARNTTTGFGDNYLGALAVALGAGEFFISLFASLPSLLSSIAQIFSAYIMKKTGLRRTMVLRGVFVHALMWLPIIATIFLDPVIGLWLLLLFVTIQKGVELFINSAWMSWFGEFVDKKTMGRYIGLKTSIGTAFALGSTILAGIILNLFESTGTLYGFIVLFSIAFFARVYTFFNLSQVPATSFNVRKTKVIFPHQFLKEKKYKPIHSFIKFNTFFMFSVMIAAPLFTLYMLRDLGFDYIQYMILISIASFIQIVSMKYWGGITDRFGNKIVLVGSSFLIAAIPILWLFSQNFYYLFTVRIFDGFVWGAFSLATYNYLLSSTNVRERSAYVTNYNLFNGISTFGGAMIGSGIALYSISNPMIFPLIGIPIVFLISGILRFVVALFMSPGLKERHLEKPYHQRHMLLRIMTILPVEGAAHTAVMGWNFGKKKIVEEENKIKNRAKQFLFGYQ